VRPRRPPSKAADDELAVAVRRQEDCETIWDQKDPDRVCFLVVFESEEKARAREQDPMRQEALQRARSMMADMFDGPPEFVDLSVVAETVGQ